MWVWILAGCGGVGVIALLWRTGALAVILEGLGELAEGIGDAFDGDDFGGDD